MRRECPAFVPFSTNTWLQKGKIRSPKLHENINVSSSVRTFPDGIGILKEMGIIYKMWMETLKEGQRDLCKRKMVKNEDKLQRGEGKAWNPWSCFKTWREKGVSTHQKMTCLAPQGLDYVRPVGLAGQFTERKGWYHHIELYLVHRTRNMTDLTSPSSKSTTKVYPTKFLLLSFIF